MRDLQVADLERSLTFYRDQLGFDMEFAYEGFYASVIRDARFGVEDAEAPPRLHSAGRHALKTRAPNDGGVM